MVAHAGYLWVIGGTNGTVSLATTLRYDPAADAWRFMAPMSVGRSSVAAAVLDGRIYAVGGSATPGGPGGPGGGPGALTSVEVYSVEADRWELLKSATTVGRTTHAVAVLSHPSGGDGAGDGGAKQTQTLYAIGGEDGGARAIEFASAERYDPAADRWTAIAAMAVPRAQVGAGVVDGVLLAVGGYNSNTEVGWTSTVEAYDPKSDSWSAATAFPLERQYLAVAVL